MSMTLFLVMSISVYDPYFAQWPGESWRPSPPRTSCSSSPICCNSCDCCRWYMRLMVGRRYSRWWSRNVCTDITLILTLLSIRRILVGLPPPYRMAQERRMLPAIAFPTLGWLYHSCLWSQSWQVASIFSWEPKHLGRTFTTVTLFDRQKVHVLNNETSWLSNTIYLSSSKMLTSLAL